MSSVPRSAPLTAWLSAILLPLGSLLFTAGGAQHPRASTAFGTVGTPDFYRTFAEHIHAQANWVPIHALILVGPLLWALGAPRRADGSSDPSDAADRSATRVADTLASRALVLGASLWAVVFVADGFVAPQVAHLVASAAPADLPTTLIVFRSNQVMVISLGLVSWILIGMAIALFGTAMLVRARFASVRGVIGMAGILVGLWPVYATITGEFNPGPFTSRLWNVTALSSAFWFAAFGISTLWRTEYDAAAHATRLTAATLAPPA
jgi:hypothetical protein